MIAPAAQAQENKEFLIKAAFIYNFVKFVQWPGEKAIGKQSRIDICVIGDSGMSQAGSVFQQASSSKLALSLVNEASPKNAASHCHIVFVAANSSEHVAEILADLKTQPVLTVSDMDEFAEHGGMIGFIEKENKIKIVVNTKSVNRAGMKVDAQLLEIAHEVIDR